MARGDAILQVDTTDAVKMLDDLGKVLSPKQLRTVIYRSMGRAAQMAKPVIKEEVQKEYKMTQGAIYKAIGKHRISYGDTAGGNLNGVSCAIPLRQARGKMAVTARGNMYRAWGIGSKGQRSRRRKANYKVHAAVYANGDSILPNKIGRNSQSGGETAAHFIMSGGRLGGQVWARTNETRYQRYKLKDGTTKVRKVQRIRPGVGISIVQMPLNKAAEPIQRKLADKLLERIIHETEVAVGAIQTGRGAVK